MNGQNTKEIEALIKQYFSGIYTGNISVLRSVFHPEALLFGNINEQDYFKNLDQYLEVVKNRKSPSEMDEPLEMKILSIETNNKVALVKASVHMLGFRYHDYLSVANLNGKWLIVNKLFSN